MHILVTISKCLEIITSLFIESLLSNSVFLFLLKINYVIFTIGKIEIDLSEIDSTLLISSFIILKIIKE